MFKTKVYSPAQNPDYATFGPPEAEIRKGADWSSFLNFLNKESVLDHWKPQNFVTWPSNSAEEKISKATVVLNRVCISAEVIETIFANETPKGVTLLPITVDKMPWYLLSCSVAATTFKKSTLECTRIPTEPPLLVDVKWIEVSDKRAKDLEIFGVVSISLTQVFFTQSIIDRFNSLNSMAIDFSHVGYLDDMA
jgi:hypothetical protein